ncbi:hypothetical protein AIT64_004900 [Salmonella enterica subsp. salamae]|nr:hypothetical protein AIT64_004900 [Salmonella enterica subsp. salamae]
MARTNKKASSHELAFFAPGSYAMAALPYPAYAALAQHVGPVSATGQ